MAILIPAKRKFLAPPLVRTIDDPRDPLNLGLLGHWSMDAETINATKMLDLSGRDNHGTLVGSPPIVQVRDRLALGFDGTSQCVSVPGTAQLNTPALTYSAWVNASAFSNAYNTIMDQNAQNALFITSAGKVAIYLVNTINYDGNGSHTLSTGLWYHVAVTYDVLTGLRGYVDGAIDGTGVSSGGAAGSGSFSIGRETGVGARFFPGAIREVRIYNRALPASEIYKLYAASSGAFQTRGRTKSSGGLSAITGALAVTETNDTIAAVGRVAVGGTLAVTEQADTINAAGAVRVAGTLARTEQPDTLAANGTVAALGAITGTLSALQAVQTLIATGQIRVNGGLNVTQAAQTLAATGIVGSIMPPGPGQGVQVIVIA